MTKKIGYEKVMTRDAPLILIAAWYKSFTTSIPKVFNFEIKFPEPIYIYKNGAVESWRATQLFFDKLPKDMSRWTKNPKNAKRLLAEFENYIKIRKKLIAEKAKPIKTVKNTEAVKQKKKSLFSKKILDKATKLRQGDTLFDDACDLIYQYLYLIAKEKKWPKNLMKLFLFQEFKRLVLVKKEFNFTEIEKRKDGYAYFANQLFTKRDIKTAIKIRGYKLIKQTSPKVTQFKGVVASMGMARGKVKIVMNREQLNKVTMGDILVSPMTTPAYMPAMIKAAAFVTDEGGIICHAAIVSREMRKPCIVGTKIATKILNDGDLVELDTNNGVVKIIRRAKST